jgi:hypothetical protein
MKDTLYTKGDSALFADYSGSMFVGHSVKGEYDVRPCFEAEARGTVFYRNSHAGPQSSFELDYTPVQVIERIVKAVSVGIECGCCTAQFKSDVKGLSCGIDPETENIIWW